MSKREEMKEKLKGDPLSLGNNLEFKTVMENKKPPKKPKFPENKSIRECDEVCGGGGKFKVSWCWLGIHDWSKWGNAEQINVYSDLDPKGRPISVLFSQKRACKLCNKKKYRKGKIF